VAAALDTPSALPTYECAGARQNWQCSQRLERGDPDLTTDELLVAIERAETKRTELLAATPESKVTFKLLERLNKAAALYRHQIVKGLDGDPRAAAKARVILRELFGGEFACSLKQMAAWLRVGICNPQRC
jgi:hypothetical protein